jgi:hypothetical protein
MVHLRVAEVPNGIPVTVVFDKLGLVIVAIPDIKVQTPVPVPDAPKVKLSLSHWLMSGPAFGAVVTVTVITEVVAELHTPLVTTA